MFNILKCNDEKPKAGIYLRVSSRKQVLEGHGLEYQRKMCMMMIEFKNLELVNIYEDRGVSGTLDENKRPGFKKMMDDIRNDLISIVVVDSIDRFGRNTRISLNVIEEFKKHKVNILSCNQNIDTSSIFGNFALTLHLGVSELEHGLILQRLKTGMDNRKKIDGETGGNLPYGYGRDELNQIVTDKGEAYIINYIYKLRYDKGYSLREIVDDLNKRNYQGRKKESKWYKTSVIRILKHEKKYLGCIRNKNENNIYWPKILT